MKLGLHTYSYHYAAGLWDYAPRESVPMTIEHYLQKAVDLNLDGLYLADTRHLDSLEYGYVSGLRERATSLGLYLELGTGGTNPDHLQNMVRTAHVLGSPVVRTMVDKPRPTSSQSMSNLLLASAREIQQVLPVCERYGVSLAIENSPQITTRELLSLVELADSEWVGVCLDTANPLAVMEDPLAVARTLAPLARTVHLKDYRLVPQPNGLDLIGCSLGEGVVDHRSILEILSSQAPEVNLNIESVVGKQAVPVLDAEYLAQFPDVPAGSLGWTLRLVRDRGLPQMPPLATEQDASEDEILAREDDLVLRSVRWAQQALDRPSPGLSDLSEQ